MFIVLTFLCQPILAQKTKPSETDYIIPFQLTEHNNLSVQAILNKKDTVNLMFHTAANSVTLTEEATKNLKTLSFNGMDTVKSWGGGENASRSSEGNSLKIGEKEWTNVSIWENKNSGPRTDGKFGTDLFENKIIEIDFDKKVIRLLTTLPDKVNKYDKLKLIFENDFMFLESGCKIGNTTFTNRFLLHSGYSGAVLFDDQFAAESKISERLKIINEKELKDSYGNVLKIKKAVLPALIIGKEKLSDVPAGFFEGAIGRQKMSIFGGDILKRFNIIIDARREYIYLKANRFKKAEYSS